MKRNMELVRDLLLEIEKAHQGNPFVMYAGEEDNYSTEEFNYHIKLMLDAGLIDGEIDYYLGGEQAATIKGISWTGHDFLDMARNENIWEQANETAKEKGSKLKELPFEVAKALLISASKQIFGL